MKQRSTSLWALLALVFCVLAIPNGAYAEEVPEEDKEETTVMTTSLGAQMRLAQLERELERKVAEMDALIRSVEARDIDATELVGLRAEFEALILSAQEAQTAADNTEKSVEAFLAIKADARNIMARVRTVMQDIVTPEDRRAVADAMRETAREQAERARERAEELRRRWHAEMTERRLASAGIEDASLVARIRAGEVTEAEVRASVQTRVRELTVEERREAAARADEAAQRARVQALALVDRVESRVAMTSERMRERADVVEDRNALAAARLRANADRLQTGTEVRAENARERIETQKSAADRARAAREEQAKRAEEQRMEEQRRREASETSRPLPGDVVACPTIAYGDCTTVGARCDGSSPDGSFVCVRGDNPCHGICERASGTNINVDAEVQVR